MSLLPIISKILERYIFEKLCTFLYISDNQWGFQAGKSSIGAVLSAVHDWQYHLDRGDEAQAIFFYLQKAFDTIPHAKLISKLSDLDIPPHGFQVISTIGNSKLCFLCNVTLHQRCIRCASGLSFGPSPLSNLC